MVSVLGSFLSTFPDFSVLIPIVLHHILHLHVWSLKICIRMVLLIGEVLHLRVNGCLLDLGSFLFLKELGFTFNRGINVFLFFLKLGISHDFLVERSNFLIEILFKESVSHIFYYLAQVICFVDSKFYPSTEESRSHFYSFLEVFFIILCSAKDCNEGLGHPNMIVAFFSHDLVHYDQYHEIKNDDEKSPNVGFFGQTKYDSP